MKTITINDLKKLKVWCNWRWATNKQGNPTKEPLQKVNFPARWLTFGQAESYARTNNLNGGVGLMFATGFSGYAICGIDIDAHHVDTNPLTKEILDMFDGTYIEKSPSGKGYHVLFLAKWDEIQNKFPDKKAYEKRYFYKNTALDVECYIAGLTNKYFTFTGDQQTDDDFLVDKTETLFRYLEKYMQRPTRVSDEGQLKLTEEERVAPIDVHQRLQVAMQAKNGAKFSALWSGDASSYPSKSEAVQALADMLTFYFGDGGTELVKEVFLSSGLAVDKWAKRSDIINATISKAFDRVHKRYTPKNSGNLSSQSIARAKNKNPQNRNKNFTGKVPLEKYEQFADYLDQRGYAIRYNCISHAFEYFGFGTESQEHLAETVPTLLRDGLREIYSRVTKQDVIDYITVYATRHKYNPILDLIMSATWDGKDRLAEIYSMFRIPEDTEDGKYSRIFIKKALMQCVCGLFNDNIAYPFPLDYVLVFQGRQGLGKTSFFKKLALNPQYFGDGFCLDPRDKDSIIQATSKWICELGEIGSTMKKDMDSVRAFISRSTDEYRTPYGKANLRYPRITTFVGTVNDSEYLIDETGNRRFLTVPIDPEVKLDYQTQIKSFDALQLWTQVYQLVKDKDKSSCFRLTKEEEDFLDKRNAKYMKPMKAEYEILDILEEEQTPEQGYTCIFKEMTVLEFIRYHNLHYDARTVGKVLSKHGYEPVQKRINGKPTRLRRLPMKKSNQSPWGF